MLKKQGLSNADIARMLNIRKQDISVLFKYLEKDKELKEELEQLKQLNKIRKSVNKETNFMAKIKAELKELELQNKELLDNLNKKEELLEQYSNALNKYKQAYKEKKQQLQKLKQTKCKGLKITSYVLGFLLGLIIIFSAYYYTQRQYTTDGIMYINLPFGFQLAKVVK